MIHIANRLEEDIKSLVTLHLPEHLPVLEPSMREDSIHPTEDIDQVSHACLRSTACFRAQRQPTGEVFGRGKDVRGPVKRVTAVIDSAAGLWGIVDGAEVLPFGGLHFGTRLDGAGRVLGEKGNDKVVDLHGEKAA